MISDKKIILSVTNDLVTDQRVHKVATSLLTEGYDVTLVGRKLKNSLSIDRVYTTKRFRLFFNKRVWFYAEYNIRLFFFLLFNRFDLYISNDLDTLFPSFIVSRLKKKALIYDSHELFCEVPELNNRKFQKRIWQKLEQFLLPKVTNNITVCESIADEYQKLYRNKFEVVRNVPFAKDKCSGLKKNENILIYQGALNKDRGIDMMIESMKYLKEYELWLVGSGDLDRELKLLAKSEGVEYNVKFLGRINFEELAKITCQASLGLSLERDSSPSYHFALPNKLFDYIQAEIPVVVSNLPEMKRIVGKYKIGGIFNGQTAKELSEFIEGIMNDKTRYSEYVKNLSNASNDLIWENENKIYIDLVKKAFDEK